MSPKKIIIVGPAHPLRGGIAAFNERMAKMTCNGLGLGEGGESEAQMFNLAQMFIRIPNVQFSTKAPLLPNPCYRAFFSVRTYLSL